MIKKYNKFFIYLYSITFASVLGWAYFLQGYTSTIVVHFTQACFNLSGLILSSITHTFAIFFWIVSIMIFLTALMYVFSSRLKTKRKLCALIQNQTHKVSPKLQLLLQNHNMLNKKVVIVQSSKYYAFSFGIISPSILLSTKLITSLSASELEAILLHELYHLNHRHPLILWYIRIVRLTLFFVPFVNILTDRVQLALEIKADMFAYSHQKTYKYLKSALLTMMEQKHDFSYSFASATNMLQQRIEFLTRKQLQNSQPKFTKIFKVFPSIVFVFIFIFLPIQNHSKQHMVSYKPNSSLDSQCSHSV